jgi:hypothetical protein
VLRPSEFPQPDCSQATSTGSTKHVIPSQSLYLVAHASCTANHRVAMPSCAIRSLLGIAPTRLRLAKLLFAAHGKSFRRDFAGLPSAADETLFGFSQRRSSASYIHGSTQEVPPRSRPDGRTSNLTLFHAYLFCGLPLPLIQNSRLAELAPFLRYITSAYDDLAS